MLSVANTNAWKMHGIWRWFWITWKILFSFFLVLFLLRVCNQVIKCITSGSSFLFQNKFCVLLIFAFSLSNCLTLSCPGMGRAAVKIGHSNCGPGSKELTSLFVGTLCLVYRSSLPKNNVTLPHDIGTGGGEIAQSLASLSMKRAAWVCSRLDPLVTERWDSITVLLTRFHQCRRLVQKRPSMCYYVCVIMHVKDP